MADGGKFSSNEGAALLKDLRNTRFEGSDEKLAIALGRSAEEVSAIIEANAPVDDDIIIKARGLTLERGLD